MRPALIFMHIPKCGGTTLTSILTEAVPEDRRYFVDGRNVARSRLELAGMAAADRQRIDLLGGHVSYGWHELLAPRPARYLTLVREPVSRVVSHYNFVRSHEAHYLHSAVVDGRMTVSDYVESGLTTEVNDGQVRQISGVEDIVQTPYGTSGVAYGDDHGTLLEEAWAHIEHHFLFVGLLERFDASVRRLRHLTGLRIRSSRARNVDRSQASTRMPSTEQVEIIRRHNRADCELYARCVEEFEQGSGRLERLKRLLIGRH